MPDYELNQHDRADEHKHVAYRLDRIWVLFQNSPGIAALPTKVPRADLFALVVARAWRVEAGDLIGQVEFVDTYLIHNQPSAAEAVALWSCRNVDEMEQLEQPSGVIAVGNSSGVDHCC